MPFKSEKQRRYLWANEPEIARDWTDTYGSKIKKAEGGISQLVKSSGNGKRPGYRGPGGYQGGRSSSAREAGAAASRTRSTSAPRSSVSSADRREQVSVARTQGQAAPTTSQIRRDVMSGPHHAGSPDKKAEQNLNTARAIINARLQPTTFNKYKNMMPYIGILSRMGIIPNAEKKMALARKQGLLRDLYKVNQTADMITPEFFDTEEGEQYLRDAGIFTTPFQGEKRDGQPEWMLLGYPSYEAWLAAQQGSGSAGTTTPTTTQTPSAFQQSLNTGAKSSIPYYVGGDPTAANLAWGQQFGVDPRTMGRTQWADGGPIRQRYFLGKLVKKIGRAAKKVIKSPLGKIGIGALAMGMPWGAGANFGAMGGKGWFGSQSGWSKMAPWILGKRNTTLPGEDAPRSGGLLDLLFKSGKEGERTWNPWKIGIGAATVAPFLMGGGDDKEQDKAFDYEGAKNAYLNEMMRIKAGALAGTLDPNKFNYLGVKDGGRIGYQSGGSEDPLLVDEYKKYVFEMEEQGLQPMSFDEFKRQALAGMASGGRAGYYTGGQSIPSANTMIDASKTEMQDRLGGITDVMKTADLYRQGDIGQMYMANGGSTQEEGIMNLGGVEKDYRETGGFVPIGKEEKADDVPARLSLNEFVMTADAVRGMGDGDIDQGAERMEDLMETLEVKGKKNQGAQDMFEVSERLSAVV